jgi:hypothetical protein
VRITASYLDNIRIHNNKIKKYEDNLNNNDLNKAYLLLNSSFMYWWWRVRDGGMTLSFETIKSLPLLDFEIDKKIINSQRMPTATLSSVTNLTKTKAGAGFFLTNQTFGPNLGIGIGIPIFNGNINKTQLKVNGVQQKQQSLQTE